MYAKGMKDNAYRHLADVGFFTNRFRVNVLEQNVLPWLTKKTAKFVQQMDSMDALPNEFVSSFFDQVEEDHRQTVQAEKERRANVKAMIEQQELEKQQEKERRRAAREAQKKANELQKLRNEVNEQFVMKGESREHMLQQDLLEINGNY